MPSFASLRPQFNAFYVRPGVQLVVRGLLKSLASAAVLVLEIPLCLQCIFLPEGIQWSIFVAHFLTEGTIWFHGIFGLYRCMRMIFTPSRYPLTRSPFISNSPLAVMIAYLRYLEVWLAVACSACWLLLWSQPWLYSECPDSRTLLDLSGRCLILALCSYVADKLCEMEEKNVVSFGARKCT